jgi:hypothetical protein
MWFHFWFPGISIKFLFRFCLKIFLSLLVVSALLSFNPNQQLQNVMLEIRLSDYHKRFQTLTPVNNKTTVFWHMTSYSFTNVFEGLLCLPSRYTSAKKKEV